MCMTIPDEAPQARKLRLEPVWPAQFQLVVYGASSVYLTPLAAACPSWLRFDPLPSQAELAELWLRTPPGRLSAKVQLRVVALRDAMQELGDGTMNLKCVASKLKVGGGGSPSRQAARVLLNKVDSDGSWDPGKSYQTWHGPAPLLTKQKHRAIATFMIAAKKRGHEPSTALAVPFCPAATLNPVTHAPFTAKHLRRAFTEECFDVTPEKPWQLPKRRTKSATSAFCAVST